MSVKVSPKYQVVIPEEVRTLLGLTPGTQVEVIAKGGIAYIVPVLTLKEIQNQFKGKIDSKNIRDKKDRKL